MAAMKLGLTWLVLTSVATAIQLVEDGPLSATIANGVIEGATTMLPSATAPANKYWGIPYQSSPPVRFAPPSPAASWQEPPNTSTFGPACIQQYITGSLLATFATLATANITQSEDCLYLNVWQPSGSPPLGGWPVMFWIHGGGLQFGSAAIPTYDGANFAGFEDVIVVSFNYRLNVFGFPSGSGLPLNETNLTAYVEMLFASIPFLVPQVLDAYATGTPGVVNESQAIAQLFGDLSFVCPVSVVANQSTAAGNLTWRYYFNSTFPNTELLPVLGVYHSSEIALVLSTYSMDGVTAQEYSGCEYVRRAWARFARNPVAGPGPNKVESFNGTDLGVLGGVGSAGVSVMPTTSVDLRCDLFTGLYAFITS